MRAGEPWPAVTGLALLMLLLLGTPAAAHSGLQPNQVDAGVSTDYTLTIPHGCTPGEPPPDPGDTVAPTVDVSVRLPEAVSEVAAQAPDGWQVEVVEEDDRTIIEWSGGEVAPEEAGTFTFVATLFGEAGDIAAFEVFQGCTEGEYRWIELPDESDDDPLEQPAPLVELLTTAADPGADTTPTPPTPPAPPTPSRAPTPSETPASPPTPAASVSPAPVASAAPTPSASASPAPVDADEGTNVGRLAAGAIAVVALGAWALIRRRSGMSENSS